MYKRLESMGAGILALFVPKAEAAAAACEWKRYPNCGANCNYGCCWAYCCDGEGCTRVQCGC
ncbi:hypothetical protein Skr01_22920 [Sphaerisporangium krabiense]|uniref:Uncharacterized protein n=1 Tax=Sphaerisporangium krabiense TaxID=763782 RepID=A0A7W9DQY2_9ACTN|nr:hypothetical protein [Sphaerisporangium krabiense]MBB5628042.1 hypothetical protein [Sphaerisporangium krabiense]GII62207.1 hypothetical protein Skr01_22920 [Sphaerisporangium krabiense]